jgi:hypothetical protein
MKKKERVQNADKLYFGFRRRKKEVFSTYFAEMHFLET